MSTPTDVLALWNALFETCHQERSGTFFLACADNKSGQVVLHNGHLIGICYAGEYGERAIDRLTVTQQLRFSFTADLIFPVAETLLPEQAAALLRGLGYADYLVRDGAESGRLIHREGDVSKQVVRVYRGRAIEEPVVDNQSVRSGDELVKPARIYRGRAVQG
ncbi:hypothetical protein GCM10011352_20610 [Marinobacterium zhoushanense]|uniref:Uncharacterized protein n=1 Tax=Marinobacterium zhoushanense TaxID=1679163 RepID=A0ABQ1KFR7_9GAMM|nr:hypothetical protein [Marinobacterium zhoushanense]GGB94436.1 hypothetical protein GCM10011352_20610 [Marinobacterium zhoushanense]